MTRTGVYPVYDNKFKIGVKGAASTEQEMKTVAELETFQVAIDGNVVEWSPLDQQGWMRRMVTGKALTVTFSGKRCLGDEGNDYVATTAWETGTGCSSKLLWEFPGGSTLEFNCIINVTNPGTGESRDLSALEFEVQSDGKPTFTPGAVAE